MAVSLDLQDSELYSAWSMIWPYGKNRDHSRSNSKLFEYTLTPTFLHAYSTEQSGPKKHQMLL